MRPARARAYRSGVLAESLVALLLRLKGHRIVARRYKTPVGEIDLVALKGRGASLSLRRSGARALRTRSWRGSAAASFAPRNIGSRATPISPATTSPSTWCSPRPGVSPLHQERLSGLAANVH
jgi:Uncharacterised protein family UPF0102